MSYILPLSYLNDACFLTLNEDDKKYQMCLQMAQDDLEDTIGTEFFDEIVSQYPSFTGQADNSAFYDPYVKNFLAWQTYFHYLKFANVASTPSGIRSFNDENSSLADDIQMYSLEKNVMNRANQYKFRMINFLNTAQANDSDKYPLWEDDCKEQMSFSITSVDKKSDSMISVNKSIRSNE